MQWVTLMDEINNETLGQTAEKVICDLCGLDSSQLISRSNLYLEGRIQPIIRDALGKLPKIVKHVGLERGARGGQSKSTVDFVCANGETISLKTTKNASFKLCPSECGQPGADTFDKYFKHLYDNGRVDYQKFKQLVLSQVDKMIPIYLEHIFDCNYLLLVYIDSPGDGHYIFKKTDLPSFDWKIERFSFTADLSTWYESCTVKYDGVSIGEFQAHNHRNCYKFRFHILNLAKVLFRNQTGASVL